MRADSPDGRSLSFSRWWLVVAGAGVMGVAGTYQFVWSSIRGPLGAQVGAGETALGTLFTLLIVFQTIAQFPAGRFRDRHGPRVPLLLGGLLLVGGYVTLAFAPSPLVAAAGVVLGGAGAGFCYTVAMNTPVKWFRKRRGLATGIVGTSYSALSVVLIPVVRGGTTGSFETSLLALGALAAVACAAGVVVLRDPDGASVAAETGENAPSGDDPGTGATNDEAGGGGESDDPTSADPPGATDRADSAGRAERTYTWREVVRTRQFWLLYVAFAAVNGVGLMLIGTVVTFAGALGLPSAAATAAASAIAFAEGAGIVVLGGASDRLGKTRTAGASLLCSGVAVAAAVLAGGRGLPTLFVVLVGAAAFFRSPVFSIFPTVVGEFYGAARSSENYAVLYTAKLWGGVFGGVFTSQLVAAVGWNASFFLGAGLLAIAGFATLSVRPVSRSA
jgi:OFA family oxalate/formate antiporter-like MFS transporter